MLRCIASMHRRVHTSKQQTTKRQPPVTNATSPATPAHPDARRWPVGSRLRPCAGSPSPSSPPLAAPPLLLAVLVWPSGASAVDAGGDETRSRPSCTPATRAAERCPAARRPTTGSWATARPGAHRRARRGRLGRDAHPGRSAIRRVARLQRRHQRARPATGHRPRRRREVRAEVRSLGGNAGSFEISVRTDDEGPTTPATRAGRNGAAARTGPVRQWCCPPDRPPPFPRAEPQGASSRGAAGTGTLSGPWASVPQPSGARVPTCPARSTTGCCASRSSPTTARSASPSTRCATPTPSWSGPPRRSASRPGSTARSARPRRSCSSPTSSAPAAGVRPLHHDQGRVRQARPPAGAAPPPTSSRCAPPARWNHLARVLPVGGRGR